MFQLILLGLIDGFCTFPIYIGVTNLALKILKPNGAILILAAFFSCLFVGFFILGTHWIANWPLKNIPELSIYFVLAFFLGALIGKLIFRSKLEIP